MIERLCPILELSVVFPGAILAYLPMKNHLRVNFRRLFILVFSLLGIWCILLGLFSYSLKLNTDWSMILILLFFATVYIRTLSIPPLKAINVLLAICAVFSYLHNIARSLNTFLAPASTQPWLTPKACGIYILLCIVFTAAASYPAMHTAAELLKEENIAWTWYIFWIIPVIFIIQNRIMISAKLKIIQPGELSKEYIALNLFFVLILCFFYAIFCLLAKKLTQYDRLQVEHQFLLMQQTQYKSLTAAIEETKESRHDMRHHYRVLYGLLKEGAIKEAENYLVSVQDHLPDTELVLCHNPAVNSVAWYYTVQFQKNAVNYSFKLELPKNLSGVEMDLCLVLSNLLENALEASLRIKISERHVQVKASRHSSSVIVLSVKNTFDGVVCKKEDIFLSAKRNSPGIGLQSIKRIADRHGGYCRFTYEKEVFSSNVMLRCPDRPIG